MTPTLFIHRFSASPAHWPMIPKANNQLSLFPKEKGHEKNVLFLKIYAKSNPHLYCSKQQLQVFTRNFKERQSFSKGEKNVFLWCFSGKNSLQSYSLELLN